MAQSDSTHRPYHHGDLRRAIVESALDMLNEGGSHFTLREVARRAGVSHTAPYKHFPDKAALLAEVALVGFDRLTKVLIGARAGAPDDFDGAFSAGAQAYIAFGKDNPALYRLMFGGEATNLQGVHLDARARGTLEIVIGLLQRGQEAGVIRKRPVQGQATACWAQLHGLTMLAIDGLLMPQKVGDRPIEDALRTLREGLDAPLR